MKNIKDNRPPFAVLDGREADKIFKDIHTPSYVIDEGSIIKNCKILKNVSERTGAKILLAQKAFSNFAFYPLMSEYLSGTEASGLYEARLGFEEMKDREVHVFSAAYSEDDFNEILKYADHIVFNSVSQLKKFGPSAKGKSLGLRINPECSTQDGHAIYDPCAPMSRLGVTRDVFDEEMDENLLSLLDGLHFHTLCEQNSDALAITLDAVEKKFGDILSEMKWVNFGGGHHITRQDYDIGTLCKCISEAQNKWKVKVYLEPGEAIALNAGFMVCRVLDIVRNGGGKIAILDASAACHMPDVIEMPYLPPLYEASDNASDRRTYKYRLAGPTCLAGDVIGDYYFDKGLSPGNMLVFGDMAIYTMCKNNTFNGMALPDINVLKENGDIVNLRTFSYMDFKQRLS